MTRNVLRLVLDHRVRTGSGAVDLPPVVADDLHIHLHIGPTDQQDPGPAVMSRLSASVMQGRSGPGFLRPITLGVAGVLLAFGAFEAGSLSGEGHARALASSQTTAGSLASLVPGTQPSLLPALSPNQMPAALRQQLAQQPTITAPPGAPALGGTRDPFGLQH